MQLQRTQTLIASVNLIGDTLTQTPAIHRYMEEHPNDDVTWLLHENPSTELFLHCGIPVRRIRSEDPGDSSAVSEMRVPGMDFHKKISLSCTKAWNLSLNKGEHIAQGYARQLGVKLDGHEVVPILNLPASRLRENGRRWLPVSINSASNDPVDGDGFSGNKNFPVKRWVEVLKPFVARGYVPIQLLGPEDHVEIPGIDLACCSIVEAAQFIRDCGVYAGVDNGITHIAVAVGAKCFVIYPECLPTTWVGYGFTGRYHLAQQHAYHGDVDRVLRKWLPHI